MFDTPDLGPVCLAPFIGVFVGFLVYGSGLLVRWLVERKTGKPVSWPRSLTLAITLVIFPVSCVASASLNIGAHDPLPWFKPTPRNVIGEWQLASDTVDALEHRENFPVQEHMLVFKDDGTFTMTNVPNFWANFRTITDDKRYVTGSGTWRITQPHEQRVVVAKFHTVSDTQYEGSEVTFYFEKHLPPYQLVIRWFEGKESSLMFRFDKQ